MPIILLMMIVRSLSVTREEADNFSEPISGYLQQIEAESVRGDQIIGWFLNTQSGAYYMYIYILMGSVSVFLPI